MSEASSVVLYLPELLNYVFRGLDKKTQSRCARVCKSWLQIAVYCLWGELDSVLPLLQLLGDFKVEGQNLSHSWVGAKHVIGNKTLSFLTLPSEQCWKRFHAYASFVTSLRISSYPCYDHKPYFTRDNAVYFGKPMLQIIANGQKYPHLLPNIISLHVDASKNLSVLSLATLLFGQLKCLELVVDVQPRRPATSWTPLKVFFNDAIILSPHLQSFGIKATPGADSKWHAGNHPHHLELDEVIRDFLVRLHGSYLTAVKVNSTMLTPDLFEMLSRFPRIQSLRNSGRRTYYTPKCIRISSPLPQNAFPELKTLFLPIKAQSVDIVVRNLRPILGDLTSLTIGCRDYATPPACHDLFVAISQCCPLLSSLEIVACTSSNLVGGKSNQTLEWSEEYRDPDSRARRLRSLALGPILELQCLRELTILLDFVVPIDDHELEDALLRRRTPLEVLQLAWTPRRMDLDEPGLSLEALRIVARYCPKIRILSLFVRVKPLTDKSLSSSSTFTCLEELNFGLSVIPKNLVQPTTKMLCDLFRNNDTPEISASLHTGHFDKCQFEPARVMGVQLNHKHWEEVVDAVNRMKDTRNRSRLRRFARSEGRIGSGSGELAT